MAVVLIENVDYKKFYPVARTRFLWDITSGIFTPYQRYEKQFHDVRFYSPRFAQEPYTHLKNDLGEKAYQPEMNVNTVVNSQFIPLENLSPQINRIGITKEGKFVYIRLEDIKEDLIEAIAQNDIEPLLKKYQVKEIDGGIFLNDVTDLINQNSMAIEYETYLIKSDSNFISPSNNVYIDKTAKIQQFVSLQAESGPIVIDKGAVVRSFSIIDGPAYIGKNSIIDSAKIRPGTTIKDVCRIGGEVEASIVESYSNKHHEGFLGHSYVGNWVNIGAMATTSDLKNNYGNIRIQIEDEVIDTKSIKFGSIICDYSRIGIGLMIPTGTVISEGSNLFLDENQNLPKYTAPFTWGKDSQYESARFIEDTRKIMARRNIQLSEEKVKFLKGIYPAEKVKHGAKSAVEKEPAKKKAASK